MKKYKIGDSELITQYKSGNEKAFEELTLRHKNKIYTTILLIVKDSEIAEDLLQETFIKAIKTIKTGRIITPSNLKLYAAQRMSLRTIVKTLSIAIMIEPQPIL